MKKGTAVINWIFLVIIFTIIIIVALCGCHVQKHSVKEKAVIDSTALFEKSDSIRFLKSENERLEAKVRELSYTQVLFDTVFIAGDTVVNTVVIRDDGTVEATGKIKSLTVSKERLTSIIAEKNRVIDSLLKVKQKEKIVLQKETVTKTRDVKKKVIPIWVWLLVAGLIVFSFRKEILNRIIK